MDWGSAGTIYAMLFGTCLFFTVLLNGILLKFLHTLGTKDQPGKVMVRWSQQSKPAIGGISFFIAFLLTLAFGAVVATEQMLADLQLLGWIGAASLAFLSGLADDAFNTRPFLKFIAQLSCALILISTGTFIQLFDLEVLNWLLTVLWIVGLMNSINMLDNMDAITTVVSLFILIFFQMSLAISGNVLSFLMVIFFGLAATLLGFLFHNWHPSRIFMGDSGSQFLGLILGAGGILLCWNHAYFEPLVTDPRAVILPLIVFLLPIADTTLVTVNRLLHGQSPFVGGRDHSTHNLSYLGLRDNMVAVIYSFLSMIQFSLALGMILFITKWSFFWTSLYTGYIAFVILMMFLIAWKNRKAKKYAYGKQT